ncbi:MAG: 2-C-methyl-D-erythritol 4-phosphate cytidylyltransferase [Firmicutes bacterium]|nr:2-C-methyl-D-erythritol 4-phosphate cytidylyltransferase [Candidatus Fermentithermobacillaceae bacterium]
MNEELWCIIPAAGYGTRACSKEPKQFVTISGKTVLEWTAERVLALPEVRGCVLALPPGFENDLRILDIVSNLGQTYLKPVVAIEGGDHRQTSVMRALDEIPAGTRWVMIHDASRPLFSASLFRRVFEAAKSISAAVCGIEPVDTVKAVSFDGEEILSLVGMTLNRDGLVLVQTPQIFDYGLLRFAHQRAREDGFIGTDDSQLVERLGHKVAIVPGERTNLKITFPEDFVLAASLLESDSSREKGHKRKTAERPAAAHRGMRKKRYRGEDARPNGYLVSGFGLDIHPLVPERKCILGGVGIPFEKGLSGHSDADVLCHAVTDAILGALNMGDIGVWYPPGDPLYKDARSLDLLSAMWAAVRKKAKIVHLDCTVVAQSPRVSPYIEDMRENISRALDISEDRISIKGTSPENIGALGRGEGIAAFCVATVFKKGRG